MTGREKLKPGIYIISLPIGNSKDGVPGWIQANQNY